MASISTSTLSSLPSITSRIALPSLAVPPPPQNISSIVPSTPSTSPTQILQALPPALSTPPRPQSNNGLSPEAKVGIGVGVPLGTILIFLLGFLFFRSRRGRPGSSSNSSDRTFGATKSDVENEGSIATIAKSKTVRGRQISSPRGGENIRPHTANSTLSMAEVYEAPPRSRSVHSDGLRSHPITPTHETFAAAMARSRSQENLNRSRSQENLGRSYHSSESPPPALPSPRYPPGIFGSAVNRPSSARRTPPTSAPRTPTSAPRTPTDFATPAEFPPLPTTYHSYSYSPTIKQDPRTGAPRLSLSLGTMPPTPSTMAGHMGGVNSGETPPGDSPTLGAQGEPSFVASIPQAAYLASMIAAGGPERLPPPLTTEGVRDDLALLKDRQSRLITRKMRLLELQRLEEEEEELSRKIEEVEGRSWSAGTGSMKKF